jgi:hypothetical protein
VNLAYYSRTTLPQEDVMEGYSREIETHMVRFFESLGERDQRRYAAVEAFKLRNGVFAYISQLVGCDPKTIQNVKSEIESDQALDSKRQRKKTAAVRRRKLLRHKLSKTSGKL